MPNHANAGRGVGVALPNGPAVRVGLPLGRSLLATDHIELVALVSLVVLPDGPVELIVLRSGFKEAPVIPERVRRDVGIPQKYESSHIDWYYAFVFNLLVLTNCPYLFYLINYVV